jgi:serine/threonine-protein kinase RsbW
MGGSSEAIDARFRLLGPNEGPVLSEAIRTAYGESYDVRWVYDTEEVSARLAAGTYVSCVAETAAGELLCHEGMSLGSAGDAVGHSGQAVTMPAARGQHLFTRTKRFLMDWACKRGMAGMYSEATAAHPYSQRSVYVPERHRRIAGQTLELCELRGTLAEPPTDATLAERTELHVAIDVDHNLALITVPVPGEDLEAAIAAERHHLFHRACLDAIYVDLPLDIPATALVADHLERLGVSYAGIFPNSRCDGDVLRMQSLHRARIKADDVAVASEHGRELLDYVLADIP